MNQTRITLHVMADTRTDAFKLARASLSRLFDSGNTCASGDTRCGTYRADIETITLPDDDEVIPPVDTRVSTR